MDYVIAIPSYKRHKILLKRSLKLLEKHKIRKSKIFIFVANNDEKKIYEEYMPDYKNIVTGKLGLKNQRTFIRNYFPANQKIVQMDDDVVQLYQLHINPIISDKYKKKLMKPIKNLNQFIIDAFQHCLEKKLFMGDLSN